MMKKGIFRFAAAVAAVLTAAAVVWAAPLSKKRATAVLMYDIDSSNRYSSATVWDYYGGVSVSRGGAYAQGAALATETIREQLLRNGYKVVSDQITARLIKAQSKPAGAGAPIRDLHGNVLDAERDYIAVIQITDARPQYSKAKIIRGRGVRRGDGIELIRKPDQVRLIGE